MPPKGANKRAAPASPVRQAPSRSAKTRSLASTASMYKEAAKFRDFDDEEQEDEGLSDIVSDPEDIISATESEDGSNHVGQESIELDSDDMGQVTTTTRRQTSAKKGSNSRSKSSAVTAASRKAPKAAEPAVRKTRAGAPKATPVSRAAAKPTSRSSPNSSSADNRKKASDLKFNIRTATSGTQASSSSSSSSSSTLSTSKKSSGVAQSFNGKSLEEEAWAEKYAPTNVSELAVHPKKIAQVREWLEKYTAAKNPPGETGGAILVLTGPAGSGKTTVLRMLAKEMDLHIVEWINSVNENNIIQRPGLPGQDSWRSSTVDGEYIPVMRAFEEFFARAHRFQPLQTQGDSGISNSPSSFSRASPFGKRKNIILIEDLPPVTAYASRKIFQDTISKFSSSGGNRSSAVLVIIISDVFSKQSTELLFASTHESREPALTIRTLLPANLLTRIDSGKNQLSSIKEIKFNPVAVTIQKKALKSLVDEEFRGSSSAYMPDTAEIAQLIDIHDGDLRATINALQFLCLLKTKERKRLQDAALKLQEDQAGFGAAIGGGPDLENIQIQGQDSSLGLFHAVARVLYNKRDWSKPPATFDRDIVKIPPHAWSKQRPPLLFNPEKDVVEKLPIELDLYTLMLHQNYGRHLNTIEECSTAMEYLCIADQFSGASSYTQAVQMQPYMSSVVVRGLLFAPKSAGPSVSRASSGGAKKHWWPELFAVNRAMRANDQMLYEVASDLAGVEMKGLSSGHIHGPGFLPKAVIRHEIVPILHRCVSMNPYMPIMNQVLRPSSKNFVRHQAAGYGLKLGMERKKEFGEGDEGFMEEIMVPSSDPLTSFGDGLDPGPPLTNAPSPSQSPWSNGVGSTSSAPQSTFKRSRPLLQQQSLHSHGSIGTLSPNEDPIEDFSD
ncbi:cell cycle checkpoint protein [Entomortierella parvispora]|uniref:Cell cycle checkpoint protein n=1 Tax=Entomortierella parvispora TaxID=205924 RepID=A0A9P3HKX9_9FUNG|nr:cell cycle checkpoint protein [Entomortierella parvispora]